MREPAHHAQSQTSAQSATGTGARIGTAALSLVKEDSDHNAEQLIALLPDAVFVHSDEHIVYANDAAARLLAAPSPESLIGRHTFSHVHPEFVDIVRQRYRRMLTENVASPLLRQKRIRDDGSTVEVETAAIPINWNGKRSLLVVNRDLTERAQAEASLRESEDRYARLVELLPDAIYIHDGDWILFINSAGARLFGAQNADEIIGRPYLDFLHPDERRKAQASSGNVLRRKDSTAFIRRRRVRLDGTAYLADVAALHMTWQDRPAALVVVRDVTDQVRAAEELREKTALFEATAEAINEGLWVFDSHQRLRAWNQRIIDLLGLPSELFAEGRTFSELMLYGIDRGDYGDCDRDAVLEEKLQIIRDGRSRVLERPGPDGKVLEVRHSPMADGGFVTTYIDITARKRAQAAREELTRQLAAQADELKRSNTELEQFAYVASHDLQEPLRMVASYCQLLQRRYGGKLGEDGDEFIGFAVEGAERMRQLINDLLAYSRVGTKGKPFAEASMEQVVGHALDNLAVAIQESGASITQDPLPTIFGDAVQLVQLMQNLIGNAIKFCAGEAPEIHIGARRDDAGWVFSVQDNGIGIEAEHIDRIFLIFQRLHTRNDYPGTGIGLAVCKKIVERHGGEIRVESEPGKGSCFYFSLQDRQS